MEKVKVNKELFDFLECYDLKNKTDDVFLNAIKKVINGEIFYGERNLVLNNINPRMFLDCIYYGYELEETKEQKLLKIFKEYDKEQEGMIDANYNIVSKKKGILECLEILNIKIDGINN